MTQTLARKEAAQPVIGSREQSVVRKHLVWLVMSVLAAVAAGLLATPGRASAQPVQTQLGAADLALLNGVRLAGLWEMPAGQMAAEKGSRPRVREIGAEIAKQHAELDRLVVDAANKLGIELPVEPNADQKTWLAEMEKATGAQFDRIFVSRLRAAHGAIFPVISAVRAGTRNEVVRELAQRSNVFVGDHMVMLESTGLVRYAELPPAAGLPQNAGLTSGAPDGQLNGIVVWVVLIAALVAGTAVTLRLRRR